LGEFLDPLHVSQYQLARQIGVPARRINEIVHRQRRIGADTGLRLARYFGTSEPGAGKEESDERAIVPLPVVFKLADTVPVRYRTLILLATFADVRWGELVRLRRENIDLDTCEIRITETLAQLDKGGLRPDTPKSRAGRRTVAFPTEIAPEIR
jgi:integrase